jgi:hypothetical protein
MKFVIKADIATRVLKSIMFDGIRKQAAGLNQAYTLENRIEPEPECHVLHIEVGEVVSDLLNLRCTSSKNRENSIAAGA